MLRRKIFAYSAVYVIGVTAAYLMFERNKYVEAIFLVVAILLTLRTVDLEYDKSKTLQERLLLIAILLFGFLWFTISFIQINQRLYNNENEVLGIAKITSLEAEVRNISTKADGYRLVVKPKDIKGTMNVQVNYYQDLPYSNPYDLIGDEIKMYGELELPSSCDNPGCFNYKLYLNSKKISHIFKAKRIRVISKNNSPLVIYKRMLFSVRESFLDNFKEEDTRAFIKGVVFGDKSDIDEETLTEFNENSTGHILAVSGLHIGFLFTLLKILTRKKKSILITIVVIVVLFLYAEMTGWSPSTARAVIVLGLSLLSTYAKRPADLLSLISTAAIVIITVNPYQLFNTGFQLSFTALMGIAFLSKPLSYFVGEYFGSMLAIQFAIMPLIAFYYSGLNVVSCFINIPIVFLASILVPICIAGLTIMIIFGWIPSIAVSIISELSDVIISINSALSFNSFFFNSVRGINPGIIVAFYIFIFLLSSEWMRIKLLRYDYRTICRVVAMLIMPILALCVALHNPFINDAVVFVSIGQGDCTHIRANGHNVLIDGGGVENYNNGKNIIKPYLLNNGANSVDVAVVTHMHMDHYQGIKELNEVFPVGKIGIPSMYVSDKSTFPISVGNRISLGNGTYIEPVWPIEQSRRSISQDNANENNMVYIVHGGGIKAMITGDLEKKDELEMIKHYKGTDKLKCNVLKVGHHGSKSSTSDEFLDAVQPVIAVISVGKNNMYGHPHREVLDRLEAHGIKTYRTDINGAVGIETRGTNHWGQRLKVDTMR